MIKPSGKLRVVVIRCILLFLWLLSEPILFFTLFLIFVFLLVIIFLVLPTTTWLSPVHLAWRVGSRCCLFLLVLIIDVEVNLGLGFMRFQSI